VKQIIAEKNEIVTDGHFLIEERQKKFFKKMILNS
jgi:hypothetical protein